MADLFTANLDSSVPASMASVNTGGNILNHSGPNGAGLHARNDSTDGWGILGVYNITGQSRPAASGRIWECTWQQNSIATSEHRILNIQTAPGMFHDSNNSFAVYRRADGTVGCNWNQLTDPDDQVPFTFAANTVYTVRIKIQPDGSARAYIEGPGTGGEWYLGSSMHGSTLNTPYTPGVAVYFCFNCYKAWASGNVGGATVNNFRVYDEIQPLTGVVYNYRAYLTPLDGEGEYGTEVEITDKVAEMGLGTLSKSVDSTDYGIGVYAYSDLKLKCLNRDGYFNDENDYRSVFNYRRDLAKIRIDFEVITILARDATGLVTQTSTATYSIFRGIVADEATTTDPRTEEISFRILSRDSVLKKVKVPPGAVVDAQSSTDAIRALLGQPEVRAVLNYDITKIDPDLEFTIDNGAAFDNQIVDDMLAQLMIATNSVFVLDASDTMSVKPRSVDATLSVLNLYGPYTNKGNILSIESVSDGRQRLFTSIKINNTERSDSGYIAAFGFRQKSFTFEFVTDPETEGEIAQRIVDEFKIPRMEMLVTVPASINPTMDLLQAVSVDYPPFIYGEAGYFLPIVGQAVIDDSEEPLPHERGSLVIHPNVKFKILEITEDPKAMTKKIKIRHDGSSYGEGYFV